MILESKKKVIKPIVFESKKYTCRSNMAITEILYKHSIKILPIVCDEVIDKCMHSEYYLDILAVAIALKIKNIGYRTLSINYFERYLEFVEEKRKSISFFDYPEYNLRSVYYSLSKLYEEKNNIDKAIEYYEKIKEFDYFRDIHLSDGKERILLDLAIDSIEIGELILKKDLNEAILYCEELKSNDFYKDKYLKVIVDEFIDKVNYLKEDDF